MNPIRDEWQTEDGSVRLLLGDCLEILPGLSRSWHIVSDPPYGIGAARMTLGNGNRKVLRADQSWDDVPADVAPIAALGLPAIIWGGNYFILPPSRCWFVWDKGTGANDFADCELAWTNLDNVVKKYFRSWVGANAKERADIDRFHPTQKPVALMEWCLGFLPGAETILDPFMGSGTTGVACIRLGRRFVGIEKEPKYFEIAKKRIRDELDKTRLIEAPRKLVQRTFA